MPSRSHNGRQHDASTRPKQLRNREVPWEGSHRSKLMSRRTERPYKVDGAGELARHSAARRSTPEIPDFGMLSRATVNVSTSVLPVVRHRNSASIVCPL